MGFVANFWGNLGIGRLYVAKVGYFNEVLCIFYCVQIR